MANCFGRIVRHGIETLHPGAPAPFDRGCGKGGASGYRHNRRGARIRALEHCADAHGRAAAEEGARWAAAAN